MNQQDSLDGNDLIDYDSLTTQVQTWLHKLMSLPEEDLQARLGVQVPLF
jgi:hypothetical protein